MFDLLNNSDPVTPEVRETFIKELGQAFAKIEGTDRHVKRVTVNASDVPRLKEICKLADIGWRGHTENDPYFHPEAPADVIGWLWGASIHADGDFPKGSISVR